MHLESNLLYSTLVHTTLPAVPNSGTIYTRKCSSTTIDILNFLTSQNVPLRWIFKWHRLTVWRSSYAADGLTMAELINP